MKRVTLKLLCLMVMPCLLSGCQGFHSSLDPAGPMAGEIYHVIRIFLWVTTPVYVIVVVCSILAVMKMRSAGDFRAGPNFMPQPGGDRGAKRGIVGVGGLPTRVF